MKVNFWGDKSQTNREIFEAKAKKMNWERDEEETMSIDYSKSKNPRLERLKGQLSKLSLEELTAVKKEAERIYARSYRIAEVSFFDGSSKLYEYKIPNDWGQSLGHLVVKTPIGFYEVVRVVKVKPSDEQRYQGRLKWAVSPITMKDLKTYQSRISAEHFLYD